MAIEFNAPSQVRPYATLSAFPTTGAVKTIYVALDTKLIYVYDSGSYTEIGDSISAEWGHINGDITSQVDLQTALNAKFDNPTGNSTQYLDGSGTPTTFPAFASADKMVTVGRNSTGSTLYKGTIVYISGSTGNRPNFVKAQANSEMTSAGTFGVIEADIANNADGNCVTIGTIDNLDTRSSAPHPFTSDTLADGDTIYLSPTTAGYITNVKPYAPSHLVYIGKVVRTSPTNGTIVYRIQNGYELDELHDVAAQTPSNNDALAFETSTQLWKPKSITTLLGFTPVTTTRTLTINGTTQDLSADRTFTISTGITIGTTAITSGTVGRVLFEGTGNVVSESANLFWDNTNGRLGIGGTPTTDLHIQKSGICIIKIQSTGNASRLDFSGSAYNNIQSNNDVPFYFDFYNTLNFRGNGGSVQALRIVGSTGNLLINTTTDAGFKLDVNGTARVATTLNVGSSSQNGLINLSRSGDGSVLSTITQTSGQLIINNGQGSGIQFNTDNVNYFHVRGFASQFAVNVTGALTSNAGFTRALLVNNVINANANNVELAAVYISPTFNNLAFTGVKNIAIQSASGGAHFNTTSVDVSSILQADSTTKGFLPPRQTQAQRTAIASPAVGLVVYQTDGTEGLYVNKSTGWALLL
jgi:hypothetical protein